MTRQKRVEQLFDELDAGLDEQSFYELQRTVPGIAETIEEMVGEGVSPRAIRAHMGRKYPNRWPQAQVLEQAARYLEAGN